MKLTAATIAISLLAAPAVAIDCHTALVLALDASDSVDTRELQQQREGLAAALRHPDVQVAISPSPGVGALMTAFEWSDPQAHVELSPWMLLDGPEAIERFAERLTNSERRLASGQTGIGAALTVAALLHGNAPVECGRKVIDVSGDGPGNIGTAPQLIRQSGVLNGLIVNGLVIRNPNLDSAQPPLRDPLPYYQKYVKFGPGAFVVIANNYDDYADAILLKLLRELSPSVASVK